MTQYFLVAEAEVYQKISSKLRFKIFSIKLQSGTHKNKCYIYLYLRVSHRFIYWCMYRWYILDSKLKDKCHPAPIQHSSPYPKKTRLVNVFLHFKVYFYLCIPATYFHVPHCDLFWYARTNSAITRLMCTKLRNHPIFQGFRRSAVEASALLGCYAPYWVVVKWRFGSLSVHSLPLTLKMGLTCYT